MEEVWKDLSLTTPSLSLLPLEPNTKSTGAKTNNASFSLTCQDLFRAPVTSCAQPFSPDNSELKFGLERNIDEGITSASAPAEDSVDRRRKRVMKNRESAARSRARKQAYTKQLQLEQGNLERENKTLKLEYAELKRKLDAQAQAPPQQATRKNVLQRTLSGPY
ncbi:protein FD-like protein [Carex littledalei]|uniref:Protein FD-like protein n=1 Tax=Carex littledalei TaxID=544730 RepID=A0A833R7Q0_9POAL|nr:protein FD-like protein [Carex littledalei]